MPFRAETVIVIFLSFCPLSAAQPPPASIEDALSYYESVCNSISCFDLQVKLVTQNNIKEVEKGKLEYTSETSEHSSFFRYYFSSGKSRIEPLRTRGRGPLSGSSVVVWDGVAKRYSGALKSGDVNYYSTDHGAVTLSSLYLGPMVGYTYVQLFRDRLRSSLSLRTEENLLILTANPEPDRRIPLQTLGFSLFLDTRKGLMPERIDIFVGEKGHYLLKNQINNELAQVPGGDWFPMRARRSLFMTEKKHEAFGKEIAHDLIEIDRSRAHFNEPIDDSVFTFEFPRGTTVTDAVNRTKYIVGGASQQEYLKELAIHGRLGLERLRTSNPPTPYKTDLSSNFWKRILIIGNAVLFVGLFSFLGYRYWRPNTNAPARR